MRAWALRWVGIVVGVGACAIPPRDNENDPAVRPELRAVVLALVPTDAAMPDVVIGSAGFLVEPQPVGDHRSWFALDARGSTDPNGDDLALAVALGTSGSLTAVEEGPRSICPDGASSPLCWTFAPGDIASFSRNAPVPVRARVRDPGGARHEDVVYLVVRDLAPRARAGSDWLLIRRTCTGTSCVAPVRLESTGSTDADPIGGDGAMDLQAYCWEELPVLGGACLDASAFAVAEASPAAICPPSAVPACSRAGRVLDVSVPVGADAAPLRRFRLHVRDRLQWGSADVADVRIGSAPLWTTASSPSRSDRLDTGSFLYTRETYQFTSSAHEPMAIASADGAPLHVLITDFETFSVLRQDPAGELEEIVWDYESVGRNLHPSASALDASGDRVWATFTMSAPGPLPGRVFAATALTDGSYDADGLDGCPEPSPPDPASPWCTEAPFDLLAASPDGSAWTARRGANTVYRLVRDGSGGITIAAVAGDFTAVHGIETDTDGTAYVSDLDSGLVRVFIPGAQGGPTVEGTPLVFDGPVDALRVAGGTLFVNQQDRGVWRVPLASPSLREPITASLGAVSQLRAADALSLWAAITNTNEVRFVDLADRREVALGMEGLATSLTGVFEDGAIVASLRRSDSPQGSELARIAFGAERFAAQTPFLGEFSAVSPEPDDGGAWVVFADPPLLARVRPDGSVAGPVITELGGLPFAAPRRVAVAPEGRAMWIAERIVSPLIPPPVIWRLATRPSVGTADVVEEAARLEVAQDSVYRIAAAPGEPYRAWALTHTAFENGPRLAFFEQDGSTLRRVTTFATWPVGPVVAPDGVAWVAKCQDFDQPFSLSTANCTCDVADAVDGDTSVPDACSVGIRLAWLAPPAAGDPLAPTAFVPPADLGECDGDGVCSVVPVGLAFDAQRNALWVAGVDHRPRDQLFSQPPTHFRFWRFACLDGGPLQTCAAPDIQVATRYGPSQDDPLATSFEGSLGASAALVEDYGALLAVEPGSGDAVFLEPVTRRVFRLRHAGTSLWAEGSVPAPDTLGLSFGR